MKKFVARLTNKPNTPIQTLIPNFTGISLSDLQQGIGWKMDGVEMVLGKYQWNGGDVWSRK
jgi:hypothetical protein